MARPWLVLDGSPPRVLPPGARTGLCFHGRVGAGLDHRSQVAMVLGGQRHVAHGNARGDFWLTLPWQAPESRGAVVIEAEVSGAGREPDRFGCGQIELTAPEPAAAVTAAPGTVAICMATFEPDPDLFRTQIESLRGQRDERWMCLISDDCSSEASVEQMRSVLGPDPRFVLSRSERRLGFYRNFERVLRMVPAGVELIALCDQDDRWHPDKLGTLRQGLGDAVMVYSDQRLTRPDGSVIRDTLWQGRRNNHTDLAAMLVANSITGAACLMRRAVMEVALPFPEFPGFQFHDHWVAIVALALGEVAYVDRPLYDYVQHERAVFGHVTHGAAPAPARWPRGERWRAALVYGILPRQAQALSVLARAGERIPPAKRRTLERFLTLTEQPTAALWLLGRAPRARASTLGSELELLPGVLSAWLGGRRRGAAAPEPPALEAFSQRRLRRWRAKM